MHLFENKPGANRIYELFAACAKQYWSAFQERWRESDYFPRATMVEPFAKAAYSVKKR